MIARLALYYVWQVGKNEKEIFSVAYRDRIHFSEEIFFVNAVRKKKKLYDKLFAEFFK